MLKALGQAFFSTGLQSPKFTAEEPKGQDYEIRTYHPTRWMSTTVSGMQGDECTSTGFRRLFRYIQGNNKTKTKVEMTAPVTCHVVPGAGPACESQFTVSFYIPDELQENPPEPTDPDVFLEDRKEFTAYVRTYGGFSNDNLKREELLKLLESLKRDGVEFVDKPYYTAGYDSPFKLTNRRNEVWVLKKQSSSKVAPINNLTNAQTNVEKDESVIYRLDALTDFDDKTKYLEDAAVIGTTCPASGANWIKKCLDLKKKKIKST